MERTREQAKERIEALKKEIERYRREYHLYDRSIISDAALDSLKKELFDLELLYPEFVTPDSPTQRVGGEPLKEFTKATHEKPMLSFNDAFSEEDMAAWFERLKNYLGRDVAQEFYCELKIDGLAIELTYENGVLRRAATRGDGKTGEDITENIMTVEAVPLRLDSAGNYPIPRHLVVRGEIFLTKKEFERINKEQAEKGGLIYANPRNIAAGSVRQLDPKVTASRKLDSFEYDVVTGIQTKTHAEEHDILRSWGFKTNKHNRLVKSLKEVFEFRDYWGDEKRRENLEYEIDGVVVILNDNNTYEEGGVVGKAPRAAIAYKFSPKEATTVVREVKFQVGRTGILTPVAVMDPVRLQGITITHATLHNMDQIGRLDLKIGDTVIISRAGDVIPQITSVLTELRTGGEKKVEMPDRCPIDGGDVVREGVFYRCSNKKCGAVHKEKLRHFVSKGAFDIEGLGPKIIERFMDEGLISDAADIFELTEGDIKALPRFGEKSAENLVREVKSKKITTLPRFIYSLGIPNVGEETAITLSVAYPDSGKVGPKKIYDFFSKLSRENLEAMEDVGPKIAEGIKRWFESEDNKDLLFRLEEAGVAAVNEMAAVSGELSGKIFVVTGTLESMGREEAKEKIRKRGGDVSESVSKKTDYVVVGENPGSKAEKAKKLGVETLSEKEFLKLIGEDHR